MAVRMGVGSWCVRAGDLVGWHTHRIRDAQGRRGYTSILGGRGEMCVGLAWLLAIFAIDHKPGCSLRQPSRRRLDEQVALALGLLDATTRDVEVGLDALDPDEALAHLDGRDTCRAAPEEGIEDDVAWLG